MAAVSNFPYTTLSRVRTYLNLASANTSDDETLRDFIRFASRSIRTYTRREFHPVRQQGTNTLKYDYPDDSLQLRFHEDILEIKGLSDLGGASEIDSSVYWLRAGDDWNQTPYDRIQLDDSSGSLFRFSGTNFRAINVDVVTGYHEDYGHAWVNSGASLTSALGSAVVSASISGSHLDDAYGRTPRFQQGQIWRLGSGGSEEYVFVTSTSTDSSTVNLIRGVNGTSAVAHAASTTVFIWDVEYDIEFSTRELVTFAYQKATAPFTNRISAFVGTQVIEMSDSWPDQTRDRLERFKKHRIYSF